MDVLFLCHRMPLPPNKGDKIRSHALLTHLAARHRVHFACFVDDSRDLVHTETVRKLAGGECLFVRLNPITKWLRAATAFPKGQPITTAYFGSATIRRWIENLRCYIEEQHDWRQDLGLLDRLLMQPGGDPLRDEAKEYGGRNEANALLSHATSMSVAGAGR